MRPGTPYLATERERQLTIARANPGGGTAIYGLYRYVPL